MSSGDGVVAAVGDWNAGGGASVAARRRGAVAEIERVLAVDVNSLGGLVRVFVDSALHLLQDLIDLDQIVLGAGVGHGRQVVLLGQRARTRRSTTDVLVVLYVLRGRSRHVVGARHGTGVEAEGTVEGEKGSAYLLVGSRVDLAALGVCKEVVDHVESALPVVVAAMVADVLSSGRVQGLLVEVQSIICRWLGSIVASMPSLVCEGGRVSPHVAIMIIVARRSWRHISLWLGENERTLDAQTELYIPLPGCAR